MIEIFIIYDSSSSSTTILSQAEDYSIHSNTSFYFQEDQTFPRQALHQKQTSIPVKEQQTEVITPAIISIPIEKNLHTSNKIERRK